ncbi:MAG: hypothetical protein F4082_02875 [Gammaproteobacteria bacterium]|nr:hypothetical protein [Gammaproteobacteria bacterium]
MQWLEEHRIGQVSLTSTGVYWRYPIRHRQSSPASALVSLNAQLFRQPVTAVIASGRRLIEPLDRLVAELPHTDIHALQ